MQQILLFSGTSEGRQLAEILSRHDIEVTVCVATEYGQEVMDESGAAKIRIGRMNQAEMEALIGAADWAEVIDATHPYAREVTENIKNACKNQNREVLRLLRGSCKQLEDSNIHYVDSAKEAAAYLNETEGNIFLTTGSKELPIYMEQIQDKTRIFARILPGTEELEKCHGLGLKGRQIICMQGPFSEELNYVMMKEVKADWLVTKETSKAGGYQEKLCAAARAGTRAIVIKRPEESGYSMEEILKRFQISIENDRWERENHKEKRAEGAKVKLNKPQISLIGIGMGNPETLTIEAYECIKEAELLVGAKRMLESLPEELRREKTEFVCYNAPEIISYIQNHPQYEKTAILFSGDVGFYSGAGEMAEQLKNLNLQNEFSYQIKIVCGISSVVYFASRLGISWKDMRLMSLHGRKQNVIGALRQQEKVFTLTSGAESVRNLSRELIQHNMEDVRIYLGRQLGSREEEIQEGTAAEFKDYKEEGLCVLILVNEKAAEAFITHGIPDEAFLRDKVPMTKEEVRSISLSKLQLRKDSVVYDIGAGTGSISVECAKAAADGSVYAVEKKPEACKLIEKNKYKLAGSNLYVIRGEAPAALADLPIPTHVFIGGSGGKLEEILNTLWEKNPKVRVVLNAISLETVTEVINLIKKYEFSYKEIVLVNVSKAKEVGNYQMMMGQNPVYVVTLQQ